MCFDPFLCFCFFLRSWFVYGQLQEARTAPKPFTKLFRRAGDRKGLYLAETKVYCCFISLSFGFLFLVLL